MQRHLLGRKIADDLIRAEDAIDHALEMSATLITSMSVGRRENQISAVLGSPAMSAMANAVRALGEARDQVVSAHGALADAAPSIGLRGLTLQGPGLAKPLEDIPRPSGRLVA